MKINQLSPFVRAGLIALPVFLFLIGCCLALSLIPNQEDSQPEPTNSQETQEEIKGEEIQLYKVTRIVDGDTLKLEIDDQEETVRLVGIDTPESVHPTKPVECYAKEASAKLKKLVFNKKIRFEFDTGQGHTDKYGRLLLYIWLPQENGEDLFINEYMVKEGYAYAYKKIPSKYLSEFSDLEAQAREKEKGLWGQACKCADKKDTEASRKCTECKKAEISYYNNDCSLRKEIVDDSNCTSACPKATTKSSTSTQPSYTCDCSKTCSQITTCAEAQYLLDVCGCTRRDGDHDGIACDTMCQ